MIWQDIVIMVANAVFSISLIPQIIDDHKKKRSGINLITSGPTTIGLFAISFSFLTLKLNLSASVTCISALLWLVIFLQKIRYKK